MANVCDLVGIKTEISSILQSANTIGASPVDLSYGMSRRVVKVLKVNPMLLPQQASFYPLVTCYVKSKEIRNEDIARDQLSTKRRCKIFLDVVGAIWNQNFKNVSEDPADEDVNKLIENVELILRSNHNLNGKVLWQRPTSLEFYSARLDSQSHLRAGFLSLEAEVFY